MAGNQATLGSGPDIARLVGRRSRLKQAIVGAEGERKTNLEAELATIEGQIADLRAQLNAALGDEA